MTTQPQKKQPSNQDVVTEELISKIREIGMLDVLHDLEDVLTKLLVAQARDRLGVPVGAPVPKEAAYKAMRQIWATTDYRNMYRSTSIGHNLQSQFSLNALRIVAEGLDLDAELKNLAAPKTPNVVATDNP